MSEFSVSVFYDDQRKSENYVVEACADLDAMLMVCEELFFVPKQNGSRLSETSGKYFRYLRQVTNAVWKDQGVRVVCCPYKATP